METIAVFFGGKSTEHDVSIVTALGAIIAPLKASGKFNIEPVYIAKDGTWYWYQRLSEISLYSSGEIEDFLLKLKPASVEFGGGLYLTKTAGLTGRRKSVKIDVAFSALHGTNGEDGSLMGLLNMAGAPYVGCGLEASVIAMNKVLSKQIAEQAGIKTTKYITLRLGEFTANSEAVIANINDNWKYPLFVKPAQLGSSIGISNLTGKSEQINAIEVTIHHLKL